MASTRKVRKSDASLSMECDEEELSSAQINAYNKSENDFNETLKKIDTLIKKNNGSIISQNDSTTLISFSQNIGHQLPQSVSLSTGGTSIISANLLKSKVMPTPNSTSNSSIKSANGTPVVTIPTSGGIVTNPNIQHGGTYQLVMDPRLGLLVSQVGQSNTNGSQVTMTNSTPVQNNAASTSIKTRQMTNTTPSLSLSNMGSPRQGLPASKVLVPFSTPNQPILKPKPPLQSQKIQPKQPNQVNSNNSAKNNNESSAPPVIDLTDDDGKTYLADTKEINFNNLAGKTFPSLVVVARPHLKLKDMTQTAISDERKFFNDRVKGILMYTPTKFTEWLIQQGLVRREHYCNSHRNVDNTPIKLKLGMYSDLTKFPHSGGYVWISDCCPQRFVSVFQGSIFEKNPHPPSILLKLLYHWCSQTSVQNVLQWVQVDKPFVKIFYTYLRAVCTVTIHEKYGMLGGPEDKIEVGVISLGTTSADGSMKQVKVEVLGVMDPVKKYIRLRAIEPLQDAERNFKKRFEKILEPLAEWVHKDSIILTDNTVDRSTLISMGYKTVHQVSIHDQNTTNYRNSNAHVMEYLRRVVPRMFQNTLSLLSRQIIQQFLDELVWRERWGYMPSRAFDAIITNLSEQTAIDSSETLMSRFSKISLNPFKIWNYSYLKSIFGNTNTNSTSMIMQTPTSSSNNNAKRIKRNGSTSEKNNSSKSHTGTPIQKPNTTLPNITSSSELVPLDSYFYGTLPGKQEIIASENKCYLNMKCFICDVVQTTNTNMMKHLISHAFNKGSDANENFRYQCHYCFKAYKTLPNLQGHLEEYHLNINSASNCIICGEKFKDQTKLILHMHHNHTELELPYECSICEFRTSSHRVIIDHFYEIHGTGEKAQCPFCLKVVTFASNGRKISQNLYFFHTHMQKHTRKTLIKKCNRCTLVFVHKGILKDHQHKDHVSFKSNPNVIPYSDVLPNVIKMPKPLASKPPIEKQFIKGPLPSNSFIANKFESLALKHIPDSAKCCECEGNINDDHFPGYLSCLKCKFATCCSRAMTEHVFVFHDPKSIKEFNVGKPVVLNKPLFCICGFSCTSGNKIAKHIAICGKKSAYSSTESAIQSPSSVPSLAPVLQENKEGSPSDKELQDSNSRENADNKRTIQTGNPPSMLNVLGLVRKPSVDESSVDRLSDSETIESGAVKEKETNFKEKSFESKDQTTVQKNIDTDPSVKISDENKSEVESMDID